MEKFIHYCWFGGKPLPKIAKKCIESWKKFLPNFKIMEWNENNVDISECEFVKEAYKNKKWAFVADYVRCKALKEYGGIYFDTDVEIIKNIAPLFNEDTKTFLGLEDSGYVAVGVWYEKEKNAFLPNELLKIYKEIQDFNTNILTEIAIPKLLSKILNKIGLKHSCSNIQYLENNIVIYPRDYFYPYSYNWEEKFITPNTYMIHYYDASWLPWKTKLELYLVRKFGKKIAYKIINLIRLLKRVMKKFIKLCTVPTRILKVYKNKNININQTYKLALEAAKQYINKYQHNNYITFYNPEWKGVSSSTNELFHNLIPLQEIYRKKDAKLIAKSISKANIKQVVFSSFAIGWKQIAIYLKKYNNNIKIKTFWHGSHSQILDFYGWERNKEIIELHRLGFVDVMGTCKESLLNFYKNQNFNAQFITNKVEVPHDNNTDNINNNTSIKIGLYAARCSDWRKNMYSQMAAISQLDKNVILDIVPLDEKAAKFAKLLRLNITGENQNLSREDLMLRMSHNDINLYVSFSECAPMVPLESLENNVPCIIGNTCHYFKGTELEDLLIVNNETDILEIKEKILHCLKNKEHILELYKVFSDENLKQNKIGLNNFLKL